MSTKCFTSISRNLFTTNIPLITKKSPFFQTRHLWQWINIIFNKVDLERKKQFGPDRCCAEWLLRNGAKVKWVGTLKYLSDYNSLPIEGTKLYIEEVDASGSSINHIGFDHFNGCKHVKKMILHDCGYLEDETLGKLEPLNGILQYLQVSQCGNISSVGLKKLHNLTELKELYLFNLDVTDKDAVTGYLEDNLKNCTVTFK